MARDDRRGRPPAPPPPRPAFAPWLEARWPERARFTPLALPPGGPLDAARGRGVVAMRYGAARFAREREGLACMVQCNLLPTVLAEADTTWLFESDEGSVELGLEGGVDEVVAALALPGLETMSREATRESLLVELAPELRPRRALSRLGVPRRHADRWLDARVRVSGPWGPSLGGVRAGFFVRGTRGPIALLWDRARAAGWHALDLAGLALDLDVERLRGVHRARSEADAAAADELFDVALVASYLRDALAGDPEATRRLAERLRPARDPEAVRVHIEGPTFLPEDLWEPPGALVSPSRARWLLAELDGLAVGGGRLAVRTDPRLGKPRRAGWREPLAARRRRLFARWDEGIEVDAEGLVGLTPEALALRIAADARGVVLDGTCGVGGLAIAHARMPAVTRVVAIDLDPARLAMARTNARVYGVDDKITFVCGDVRELASRTAADRVILDPPWGGRDYDRERVALSDLGLDLGAILATVRGELVLKLPRSFDVASLPVCAGDPPWRVEPLVDERGILKMLIARRVG